MASSSVSRLSSILNNPRLALTVALIGWLTVASLCGLYWLNTDRQMDAAIAEARRDMDRDVEQLSLATAEYLDTLLRSADVALLSLRDDYASGEPGFDTLSKQVLKAYPEGLGPFITVVGPQGELAYSTSGTREKIRVDNLEHFRFHLDNPDDKVFIGAPFIGQIANRPLIHLTRKVERQGQFIGVISFPLRPEYLARSLSRLDAHPDDIAVIRTDGRFITHSTQVDRIMSLRAPADRPYLKAGPGEHGILRVVSVVTGQPQVLGWRRMENWPLVIIAGREEESQLAALRENHNRSRREATLEMLAILFMSAGIAVLLVRLASRNRHLETVVAELHQREESLQVSRENERLLSTAVSQSNASIALTDLEGRITLVNDAFVHNTGYTRGEILGQNPRVLQSGETTPEVYKELWQTITSGRTWYGELHNKKKTGELYWESAIISPVKDEQGRITHYLAVKDNITARKAAEQALQESESRFFTAFQTSPMGMSISTFPAGEFVELNDAWLNIFGYTEAEMIGRNSRDLGLWNHPEVRDAMYATVMEQGHIENFEAVMLGKDGREIIMSVSARKVQFGGQPHMLGVISDITLQKQAQRAMEQQKDELERLVSDRTRQLATSEARFRGLVEQSIAGINIIEGGHFRYVNQAFADMFGYDAPKDIIDVLPFEELVAPEDRALVRENLRRRTEGQVESSHYGFTALRKDGSRRAVEIFGRRLDYDGKPASIGMVIDVSERKALEEARETALREAERLARVKSEFLANMSHEIRTPLNGVLGMAHIGRRESSGRLQGIFDKILNSGQMLLGIIDDILEFSKIEAGMMKVESISTAPARVMGLALDLVRDKALGKGLELALEQAPDLPATCLTDPLRLQQVLLNLLSNAVKFTESGSVTLSARRNGDRLVFAVRDTGIGITPEQEKRIFSPFEQADSSTTRRFGGTGLGLAITRRIVELMGGEICLRSTPGMGSCFEVSLPLMEAAAPAVKPGTVKPTVQAAGGLILDGLRILVAEDNEVNRIVMEDMLTSDGAEVLLAGNGEEAVARIMEDSGFNLILMDVQMPVMDGLEATRCIRLMAPEIPILGQTAHALIEDRQRCLAAGMDDVITKPVNPQLLLDTVLRLARRKLS